MGSANISIQSSARGKVVADCRAVNFFPPNSIRRFSEMGNMFDCRLLLALFFCFSVLIGFGQSGKKISSPPRPAANPELSEPEYSESTPKPKRRLIYPPGWKRDNDQTATAPPIVDITADSVEGEVRVETNLVTVPVSVFDRNGIYVPNLRQSDFTVFEDEKEQPIAFLDAARLLLPSLYCSIPARRQLIKSTKSERPPGLLSNC